MDIFERGFNYSQDGPGNRLVYHLQGCNMRCTWCSNPEGMSSTPPIMTSIESIPTSYCQRGAIKEGVLHRTVCSTCKDEVCVSEKNTKIFKKDVSQSVEKVFAEILSSKMMFFNGGGVTFTGGEVLLQCNEVLELCTLLKKEGIHTAIETNASLPSLPTLLPFIDFFIMDIKHYDEIKHREYTGVSLEPVLENLRQAVRSGRQVLLRIPLINGINTKNVDGFIAILQDFKKENLSIELLCYHEYGKDKWAQCGYEYTMQNGSVSKETYNTFKNRFIDCGFNLINT